MTEKNYNVLGVMSGTSLDGVDVAYVSLSENQGVWAYEIHEAETIPYSDEWVAELKIAVTYSNAQLQNLNQRYTVLLADIINKFIKKYDIQDLDAVCSHGHTILHQPHNGITLQIGNLPKIAQLTGQRVVCDFRVEDVKMGGRAHHLYP